ncbi:hypothetical protein [Streptomyces sp. 8N616]|uniref:hypothetical protein n=1 Tax=Streptomyces sp. 8N616 TaxID=3457414 RepID=UPI003FD402E2
MGGSRARPGHWATGPAPPTAPCPGQAAFYGDTSKRWSWGHVEDLAQAYVKILDDPAAVDGVARQASQSTT